MADIHRALTKFLLHNVKIFYQSVDPSTPILPLIPDHEDVHFDGILSELFT